MTQRAAVYRDGALTCSLDVIINPSVIRQRLGNDVLFNNVIPLLFVPNTTASYNLLMARGATDPVNNGLDFLF